MPQDKKYGLKIALGFINQEGTNLLEYLTEDRSLDLPDQNWVKHKTLKQSLARCMEFVWISGSRSVVGPWSISSKLVRNAHSWAPPQAYW